MGRAVNNLTNVLERLSIRADTADHWEELTTVANVVFPVSLTDSSLHYLHGLLEFDGRTYEMSLSMFGQYTVGIEEDNTSLVTVRQDMTWMQAKVRERCRCWRSTSAHASGSKLMNSSCITKSTRTDLRCPVPVGNLWVTCEIEYLQVNWGPAGIDPQVAGDPALVQPATPNMEIICSLTCRYGSKSDLWVAREDLYLSSFPGLERRDGLLFVDGCLIIPRVPLIHEGLFRLAHDVRRHFSFNRSYAALRHSYYWPNMRSELE